MAQKSGQTKSRNPRLRVEQFFRLTLGLVAVVQCLTLKAEIEDEQYWRASGLNQDRLMNQFLAPESCQEKEAWMGCLFTFGTLLNRDHEVSGAVYFVRPDQMDQDVETIATCSRTALVRPKVNPSERDQALAQHAKWRDRSLAALNQLYGPATRPIPATGWNQPIASRESIAEMRCYRDHTVASATAKPLELENMITAINTWAAFAFDAHSRFEPRAAFMARLQSDTSKSFAGVGITFSVNEKRYFVSQVYRGGPSFGRLQGGDEVTAVDSVATSSMENVNQFVEAVTGDPGSQVNLGVRRGFGRGARTFTVAITRAQINVSRIDFDWVEQSKELTIRLMDFGNQTLCQAMSLELQRRQPERVVLDLRGNPGGMVTMAICIAGLFTGPDLAISQSANAAYVNRGLMDPRPNVYFSARNQPYTYTGPLVVLISSLSASASEMVSGALKDYGRAIILGETSFGKGSMQTNQSADADFSGLMLWLTQDYWLTPSGASINAQGVVPHINVQMFPGLEDDRHGISYESQVGWRDVRPFDHAILRDTRPAIASRLPARCAQVQPSEFSTIEEMVTRTAGDRQLDTAKRVAECLKSANYAWTIPASNRTDVFSRIYGRTAQIRLP